MRILGFVVAGLLGAAVLLFLGGYLLYAVYLNPRVAQELRDDPNGERAGKVMLLTLPSGRELPVNYLLEGSMLYAGADGTWWRELRGDGVPVTALVRGQVLRGSARAVRDDPETTAEVFSRLRPNAVEGFGTLVEIRLAE